MFHLSLLAVALWFVNVQSGHGSDAYWSSKVDNITHLRPAGKEMDYLLYTCRASIDENVIVGKLWTGTKAFTCNVAYNGQKYYATNFEVLYDSPDTTSWVPYTGVTYITSIVGGQLNRSITFVCRAIANNWLLPGYFDQNTKKCHVEIVGQTFQVADDIEILIVNKLGVVNDSSLLGFNNKKVDPNWSALIHNPPAPFKGIIRGGFVPGAFIRVQGQILPDAKYIMVNIRPSPVSDSYAFHFNPRINEGRIIRNSYLGNTWGFEEVGGPEFKLRRGEPFEIILRSEYAYIRIAVNGEEYPSYNHRYNQLDQLTHLEIHGDITLSLVQIVGNPHCRPDGWPSP